MWAIVAHAVELSIDFSQSFASLRLRPSHANVRSTTHRLGSKTKPSALSLRLMISIDHRRTDGSVHPARRACLH